MSGWRLAAALLAWLAGIALQLQQAELPHLAWPTLQLAGAAALAGITCWRRAVGPLLRSRSRMACELALVTAAILAGHASAGLNAAVRMRDPLASALEGRDIEVVGIIASLPQRGASGLRFRLAPEAAQWRGTTIVLPPLIALGWYAGWHEDAAASSPRDTLRAGERWRFTVRLRQPHGNRNPHGFDYELYLFEQGVRATGYVRDAPAERIDTAAGYPVERLRQRIRDAIERSVPDRRVAGVLAALTVGDQSAIDRDDWQLFRNTGIAHLVSISGLHITMFAWLAGALIGSVWRRSPAAMRRVAAPHAARWGGVMLAGLYALLSGWGVPAQRTVWMLIVVSALRGMGRRWPWPLILLAAAVVVTLADPWALLQPGFWLSFLAVALLMAAAPELPGKQTRRSGNESAAEPAWRRGWRWLAGETRGALRTQAVATLGLAPLSLIFFQQIAVVGLLANLVAIPLVTLLITPLALLGVVAAPLWGVAAALVGVLIGWVGWLAGWPAAVWTSAAAPGWAQCAGIAGALLAVAPLPWRVRMLALPLALPLLLPAPHRPPDGRFDLLAVDVGQGTAVLVRTRTKLLVYDAGPQYSRDSDAGRRILLPLLLALGETRIDRLVLSHRDSDHVGGARSLLQALPVGEVLSSLEDGHPLRAPPTPQRRCVDGERWQWDGVQFDILHPSAPAYGTTTPSNALSCVLRVSTSAATGSMSALLTGDIERLQEIALVERAASVGAASSLRSDVLIAPHHGSRTSSSEALLDAVRPKVAVFQAGYRNRFGHPSQVVLDRYRQRGIRIVVSPDCGAWRWSGEGRGHCERAEALRYWHYRGAAG